MVELTDRILSWGRYLYWAELMRRRWNEYMTAHGADPETPEWLGVNAYWPASLYVVIEGWQELGLSDPIIDSLLQKQTHVDTLRLLRNGTFHYQGSLIPKKMIGFFNANDSNLWIMELQDEFWRYFREWLYRFPMTIAMRDDLRTQITALTGWFPPKEPMLGHDGQLHTDSIEENLAAIHCH